MILLHVEPVIEKLRLSAHLCIIFLVICCSPKIKSSEILITNEDLEIGYIEAGNITEINLVLNNGGQDSLIIKSITAGCNCTDITLSSYRLGPGESANMKLSIMGSSILKNGDLIDIPLVVRSNTKKEFDEFYLKGMIKSRL